MTYTISISNCNIGALNYSVNLPNYLLELKRIFLPSTLGNLSDNFYNNLLSSNSLVKFKPDFTYERFVEYTIRVLSKDSTISPLLPTNFHISLSNNYMHNCLQHKINSLLSLIYYGNNDLLMYSIYILTLLLMIYGSYIIGNIFSYLLYYLLLPKNIALIIMLLSFISICNADIINLTVTQNTVFIILVTLGSLLYLVLGSIFDFYSYKWVKNASLRFNTPSDIKLSLIGWIMHNKLAFNRRSILGAIYLFYIISGVFSTNSVWFLLQSLEFTSHHNLLLGIMTAFSTVIFALLWYIFRINLIHASVSSLVINSIFRSGMELASFNSIAYSTYVMWGFWQTNSYLYDNSIIALFIGLVIHLPFSYLTILSEIRLESTMFYGVYYYFSFLGIAISTNGFYGLLSSFFELYNVIIPTILVSAVITAILYPDQYRIYSNNGSNDTLFWIVIRAMLRYYFLVLSFVILNQLIFNFIW